MQRHPSSSLLTTSSFPPAILPAARLVGRTPYISLPADPRVSYTLYVPAAHYPAPSSSSPASSSASAPPLPLLVTIHGTTRDASAARDALVALAERDKAAVLAPLFPAGVEGVNDWDSFKILRRGTGTGTGEDEVEEGLVNAATATQSLLQADTALLAILDNVAARWPGIDTRRIILGGFSGGGSFALRFAMLYPERVRAVSIGAPTGGSVIGRRERNQKWPVGLADVGLVFGSDRGGSFEEVGERIRTGMKGANRGWQLVVGDADRGIEGSLEGLAAVVETERRKARMGGGPGGSGGGNEHDGGDLDAKIDWEAVLNRLVPDRRKVLEDVKQGLGDWGIRAEVEVVPGAGHVPMELAPAVEPFLRRHLAVHWWEEQERSSEE